MFTFGLHFQFLRLFVEDHVFKICGISCILKYFGCVLMQKYEDYANFIVVDIIFNINRQILHQ